jgi:hypothetical protein
MFSTVTGSGSLPGEQPSEKWEIPLACGIADGETRTRTGGHHDFQSSVEISLTAA